MERRNEKTHHEGYENRLEACDFLAEEIKEKMVAKDQSRRLLRYTEVQNELIASGKSLVHAKSYGEAYSRFLRVLTHVERLWQDACILYLQQRYPTALALSITCLEEIGKIGVARFQLVLEDNHRKSGRTPSKTSCIPRRKHPFYSHSQKLLLAAGAGALVNSRLDRILGLDAVVDFLEAVERDEIELLRQSCLYSDTKSDQLLLPYERVGNKTAEFYVVLAGELLAEVGGFEPTEWQRLIKKVQNFERQIDHRYK